VMAGAKLDRETRLNYTIRPFAREFLDAASSVKLRSAKQLERLFHYKTFMKV